ncbi:MAG: exodeoxyribonuclease VII small subunit [Planctomycetes bacterium]|nr:exodeoxyribonuclease VII small subunit [Planctomycetota bacterium]
MARKKEEERFDVLVAQVEDALRLLEGGELPLEEALKRYEEGVGALRRCYEILKKAEAKVQLLSERDGEPQTQPFDVEEGEGDEPKNKLF